MGAIGPERSGTASALANVARMRGATLGVSMRGAAYAASGGGVPGLRVAMPCGGAVQLVLRGRGMAAWGRPPFVRQTD
ncbi:hypothetical protein TK49_18985 [Ralstonia mannitolilytica]|nr:hypothetical protein TK49_18985 [Ralstonia mannitolilytica]